jgi:hypothetical protein
MAGVSRHLSGHVGMVSKWGEGGTPRVYLSGWERDVALSRINSMTHRDAPFFFM